MESDIIKSAGELLPDIPRNCLVAVYRLSTPHSAISLVHAAIRIQSLLRTHAWLETDLETFYPGIAELTKRAIAVKERREHYPAGSTSDILRAILTSSDISTSSLQGLLLAISARYHANISDKHHFPNTPESATPQLQSAHRAIDALSSAINGYQKFPRRDELLQILKRADGTSLRPDTPPRPVTVTQYAKNLTQELGLAPQVHGRLHATRTAILSALDLPTPTRKIRKRAKKDRLVIDQPYSAIPGSA